MDFAGGIGSKLNAAQRIFGKGSIKKEFARMLNEFNPDVVHLHNIHSYLSPIVAKLAKEYGITNGKAQLINQIIATNGRDTFKDLAPLTINQLNQIIPIYHHLSQKLRDS